MNIIRRIRKQKSRFLFDLRVLSASQYHRPVLEYVFHTFEFHWEISHSFPSKEYSTVSWNLDFAHYEACLRWWSPWQDWFPDEIGNPETKRKRSHTNTTRQSIFIRNLPRHFLSFCWTTRRWHPAMRMVSNQNNGWKEKNWPWSSTRRWTTRKI